MRTTTLLAVLLALVAAGTSASSHSEKVRVCALAQVADAMSDLAAAHSRLEMVSASNPAEMLDQVSGCHAILGIPGRAAELIGAGSNLKWIQTMSAGVENFVSIPALVDSDITLTNLKILQGPEIADHAMALLLNLTRDMKFFNEQMSSGWERRSRLPMIELRGKTMLIIGLGGIGTQIAQRAAAFDMRVIAIDPKDIPLHRDVAYVGQPEELDELLPEADVVVSSVPLTAESKGMLSTGQFAAMKDGVYLINISRGGVVDTNALVEALRSGKVRAAGLDVTDPEPLPTDHPLWALDNVTISPHLATASDRLAERRIALFRDNLERFLTGKPLRNVVDKQKGY